MRSRKMDGEREKKREREEEKSVIVRVCWVVVLR